MDNFHRKNLKRKKGIKNPFYLLMNSVQSLINTRPFFRNPSIQSNLSALPPSKTEDMRPTLTLLLLLLPLFLILCLTSANPSSSTYNIVTLGARPDGKTDSTNAFIKAWTLACRSSDHPTIHVPPGRFMVQKAVTFSGSRCKNKGVNFDIKGTLLAPSDFRVLGNSGTWLMFEDVVGVTLSGGVLDGQGSSLWACKRTGKGGCPDGLTVSVKLLLNLPFMFFWYELQKGLKK